MSDIAQHYLVQRGITAIRRLRKTDNNRIARACGATIIHDTAELQDKHVGTGCGLFEVCCCITVTRRVQLNSLGQLPYRLFERVYVCRIALH